MAIIRMYRRDDKGTLEFREAWYEQFEDQELGQFVLNHGTVGYQSKTRESKDVDAETGAALLAGFEEQCSDDGFAELEDADQFWVVAQYALKTVEGTDRDKHLLRRAEEVLRGHLAWRGLGTVESSDFTPRKLNIRILSPEPSKAVSAIKTCLRDAQLDFTKLSIGVAPHGEPDSLKQKHPLPAKGRFSLT
ncbi:hypothetical protein [Arthrobacter sp. KK5.5]|uniref:hypothetical protein n=1 Tax=Arthrobacter sp. KK5.5 TaxID=3373084 RepID=UPI003EE76B72